VSSGAFYISATEATAQQAGYLEVAPSSALLVIKRISNITGDEPVYVRERYYRPNRVQYRVMLRRHNDESGGSKIDDFRAVFAEHALAAEDYY
jgi:GntR family transcriptional regulator